MQRDVRTHTSRPKPDRRKAWSERKLAFKVHGNVQGCLIVAARMFRPGSLANRTLYRAADLYWWHFHFKKRWGSGY